VGKPVGSVVTAVSVVAAAAFSETVLQQTEMVQLLVRAILLAAARMRMVVSVVLQQRVAPVDSVDSELLAVAWVTMAAAVAGTVVLEVAGTRLLRREQLVLAEAVQITATVGRVA
jgi:hypothetical protein